MGSYDEICYLFQHEAWIVNATENICTRVLFEPAGTRNE